VVNNQQIMERKNKSENTEPGSIRLEKRLISQVQKQLLGIVLFTVLLGQLCAWAQDSSGVRRVGFIPFQHSSGIHVFDNYCYVGGRYDSIRVFDISNPSEPHYVGSFYGPWGINGIKVLGTSCFMSHANGISIFNVADPEEPVNIGNLFGTDIQGLAIEDQYYYTIDYHPTDFPMDMWVLDIHNLCRPRRVGAYNFEGHAHNLAVQNGYCYLADTDHGLHTIDVSDPEEPEFLGLNPTPNRAYDLVIQGDYLYLADAADDDEGGLRIFDISSPDWEWQRSFFNTPHRTKYVAVSGDYCWISCPYDSSYTLYVINVSDPGNPHEVGFYTSCGDRYRYPHIAICGTICYVADHYGLTIYDCSDAMSISTSIGAIPIQTTLLSAYPNPFNNEVILYFDLPIFTKISLCIFNLSGEQLIELKRGYFYPGRHSVKWNTNNFSTGVYIAGFENSIGVSTKKLILIR